MGLRSPAPILATYMARRPPAFTRNAAGARHINIAHGLYPRVELPEPVVARLVESLRRTVSVDDGRTYAGGLTKFEPREMERLAVPEPVPRAGGRPRGTRVPAPSALEPRAARARGRLGRSRASGRSAARSRSTSTSSHLDEYLGTVEELIELTVDLAQLRERAAEVVTEPALLEALRFSPGRSSRSTTCA